MLLLLQSAAAQQDSSKPTVPVHSARKAVILSACLPGAGQVYNRKAWKVPIIYGLGGACGYMASLQNRNYKAYRNGFRIVADTTNRVSTYVVNGITYNQNGLRLGRDDARKWRDTFLIGTVAVYLLNLVDANVDGHLYGFEMSNNLGLYATPTGVTVAFCW